MPKATQSIIYSYIPIDALESMDKRHDALLFYNYFGGSMSSVMFQEIREFRSLAYSVWANIRRPVWKERTKKCRFITFMSTQSDKTLDALVVLDSLKQNMPFISSAIETTRKDIYNEISGGYPVFRDISTRIADIIRSGYDEDPTKYVLKYLDEVDLDNAEAFFNQYLKNKPVVYCIVGDAKKIDMKRLEAFGKIKSVKKHDIFKW
jgi:predicted Zn-dependent peptidase